jgi:hypothetical protein
MVYTTEMARPARPVTLVTAGASIGFIQDRDPRGSCALMSTDTIDWQWRIPFIALCCVGGCPATRSREKR